MTFCYINGEAIKIRFGKLEILKQYVLGLEEQPLFQTK